MRLQGVRSPMNNLEKVGVVGAGLMGSEIALCFAMSDRRVALKDASLELAQKGVARLSAVLDRNIAKGRFDQQNKEPTLSRITPVDTWDPFEETEVVIEAVFESFQVKSEVFKNLDRVCKPECLLFTNTSSIPITQLASTVQLQRRPRFLGTHFFAPVSVMQLVEVIVGLETSEETATQALEICRKIGKTPIRVKDVPGFAVNRILHAMLIEACRLVEEEVVSVEDCDIACKLGLGHPIGPYTLMDLAGNDLILQIHEILCQGYGERFMPRPNLKQKVYAGHLGRKAGTGWLKYGKA
jgi:3-hydroxybutyryl-CoA dehydrogenase